MGSNVWRLRLPSKDLEIVPFFSLSKAIALFPSVAENNCAKHFPRSLKRGLGLGFALACGS